MALPDVVIDVKVPEAERIPRPEPGWLEEAPRRIYLKAHNFETHGFRWVPKSAWL